MAWLRRHARTAGVATLIAAAMLLADIAGGLKLFDNALHDLRVRTLSMPASGDLVVVEIDATSVRRLGAWPWPRGHHAMVLDRLLDAGAAAVAFDISFSSLSDEAHDQRLAEAAARADGRLILPIFRQLHQAEDGRQQVLLDRPFPALERAARLASINVQPDGDGIVRSLLAVDQFGETAVPSMSAALLAPHQDDAIPQGRFVLDFGIDIATIPRLTYADVLLGRFDAAAVAGKSVLIGATAVELGDILTVPRWGNLPGPFVIATGFESMRLGRAITPIGDAWFLFVLCLAAALAPMVGRTEGVAGAIVPALLQLVGLLALGEALYAFWAITWDLAPVAAALVVSYGIEIGRVLRAQACRIVEHSREARRRIALLRSVVDTNIDAVVIADRDGVIQIANPACLTVFGYDPETLIGIRAEMLIDREHPITGLLHAMTRSGGSVPPLNYPIEVAGVHQDGHLLELDLALASVGADGSLNPAELDERYTIHLFRDVSEQRRLEAMRRETLQAQVEAERSKADFLSTASHELRTPLNHIKGFTALLATGIGGEITDKQRSYLIDIDGAADHLTGIVTDILAMAQTAGPDDGARRMVALAEIVEAARCQVSALAESRGVELRISSSVDEAMLMADCEGLERALMHLMRNAVQFSPPHDEVAVSCSSAAGGRVRIEISDRGLGMTDDELERVQELFGQLEGALSRSHGGLGIGLSVARTCIESHSGTLSLASEKGHGTTACIELPLAQPESRRSAA